VIHGGPLSLWECRPYCLPSPALHNCLNKLPSNESQRGGMPALPVVFRFLPCRMVSTWWMITPNKMETATSPKPAASAESELETRQKSTARTVQGLLIGVVLLGVLAFVSRKFLTLHTNPSLHMAFLITILGLGLGAIAFRRTRFSAIRLQDIASLRGPSGLLITLQRTTLEIALIGAAAAVVGFVATLVSGDDTYTYRGGLVAVAVLLYCYPMRGAWQRALQRFSPAQNGTDSPQNLS